MIYVTQFLNDEDKTVTEHSVDSGFTSFDEVVELLGEPIIRAKRYVVYDGQLYSDFIWSRT